MRTDRDPNRGKRRIPLSWFSAADLLGLKDEPRMFQQERNEVHRLATVLANTRPDDHGTEGEWALRLHEAGVRPPKVRPAISDES